MNPEKKRIRLRSLLLIHCLTILAIGFVWLMNAGHRQDKVALTVFILFLTVVLDLVWLLGFSRLNWKVKFISVGLSLFCIAALIFLFRFDGFSGDLVPRFVYRWRNASTPFVNTAFTHETADIQQLTDFPQFLGPSHNAVITHTKLNTDWKKYPPQLIWRQPIGEGWGGFAVVGHSAVTQEQQNQWEQVVCYDLLTGKEKWTHRDAARYDTALAGPGPRATPTIDGQYVYTLGSTGILNCLNFKTGQQIWTTNIFEENNANKPPWGISCSPLVHDGLVILSAGGAVAYDKKTGDIAWTGHRHQSAYSSPALLTLANTQQVVLFEDGLITSHAPNTGQLLWKQTWPKAGVECATQPIPLPEDKLLLSSAYGIGSKLFQISKSNPSGEFDVNLLWETIQFKVKFSTIIYHHGYLYGLDDGIFACINAANGKRQWKRGRYGHGQTLLISDILLILTESGELVLLQPNPEKHAELARFQAIHGQTWNNPALVGNYLLVRNNREAACYRLAIHE